MAMTFPIHLHYFRINRHLMLICWWALAGFPLWTTAQNADTSWIRQVTQPASPSDFFSGILGWTRQMQQRQTGAGTPSGPFELAKQIDMQLTTETIGRALVQLEGSLPEKISLELQTDLITWQTDRHTFLRSSQDPGSDWTVRLDEPVTGTLEFSDQQLPLYLCPGDSLVFHWKGSFEWPQLTGTGAEANLQYWRFYQHFKGRDQYLREAVASLEPMDFYAAMTALYGEKLRYLAAIFEGTVTEFSQFMHQDLEYWYRFYLLNYLWEKPLYHEQPAPLTNVSAAYFDFLKAPQVSNEAAFPSMNYLYFIQQYLDYCRAYTPAGDNEEAFWAGRLLNGKPKAYYEARRLAAACKLGKAMDFQKDIRSFLDSDAPLAWRESVQQAWQEQQPPAEGKAAPDFKLVDADGKTVTLEDFRGKVVLLGFWATWCPTCIRNFPFAKDLANRFPETEFVQLYVSLDENRLTWKKFLSEHRLSGMQLHAGSGNNRQRIDRTYRVRFLPAYLLIDREGKLAHFPAAGLGSFTLREQIRNLLTVR